MDTNLHVSRSNEYVKAEYCKQNTPCSETFYLFMFPESF